MYDPLIINPAMTLGGKQAAFAASASGMTLKLTHVQFGTAMYDPKGTETALKSPVGGRVTLAGGARPTQYQIRMLAAWREDLGGETAVTEIGYYAGNVLAFIWSNEEGEAAFIKTDGVPAVLFSDIGFESVPAGSVDISIDPAEQIALAALAAHESASNAHPQYVEHALFPDAQADMWMSVTGSANALVLSPPIDVKVPAYKVGQAFRFQAAYSSTGPVSANINGLGAKAVVKSGGTVLAPGDLRANAIYDLIYDGSRFQLAGGVGGGQFYVEWPTVAAADQTKFNAAYTPGSEMVFVNGSKLAKDKYVATDGQTFTLTNGVAADALVTMVAYSTFAVADTYTKGEYQSFVATLAQAQNKGTTVVDRWMNPSLVHAAISARVQPSLYDTTAGSLLVPGSFGSGATKLSATASIDNLAVSGTYGWGPTTVGRPVDTESGQVIHMTGDTAAFATQLVTSHTSKRAWLRRKNNSSWATVELFTSDNQLPIGNTPELARMALELGTAARADLTVGRRDSTIGRVLRVGDFGLGSDDLDDLSIDLDTLTATGFYVVGGASVANTPAGLGIGMVIVVSNAKWWTQQIYMPQGQARMFQRACNNKVWSAWTEVWNGSNLEKTTSSADATLGRLLKVGDYGIGAKALMTNNLISNIDDVTLPNGMYAVSNTTLGAKPSTYGILLQEGRNNVATALGRVSQTFIDVEQANNPRIYHRIYVSASNTWGAWYEDWHSGNLVKTISSTDVEPGRMVKVGDYGLGAQLSVTDANDAVVSGFYRLDSSYKNSPATGKAVWILAQAFNANVLQYASLAGTATSEMWIRKKVAGSNTWTPWTELAKAGDFGLGSTSLASISNIDDQTLGNGWYAVISSTGGAKPISFGVLHVSGRNNFSGSGGRVAQTFYSTDGAPRVWNRTYTGTAADTEWSAWGESWHTGNLVKTESAEDTTSGRMLKVGDYGLGTLAAPKTVINSNAEWAKPGGWSGYIDIAASKAKGATVPVSTANTTPVYGMWQIVGRRDSSNGYTGIFTDYSSGRMWIGFALAGADGPTFKELFSEVSVSAFTQTLLDDTSQAAAQTTLGIPALINTLVYGITTKNIAGNANVTLTAVEAAAGILWFTGALTGNVEVTVPAGQSKWTVYNRTTGNFTLRIKASGGSSQLIPQGKQADIVNTGTSLYYGANAFPDARFTGEVVIAHTGGLRLIDSTAKYGTIWRNDGAYLYLLQTELNDPDGAWSTKRPFVMNLSTGQIAFSEGATVASPGARDNSLRIPGTSWVQAEIQYNTRRFYGVGIGAPANITLSATDTGRWVNMTGNGGTATLPASTSIDDGMPFVIRNASNSIVNIVHGGGGQIQQEPGNNSNVLKLKPNEWVELTSSGSSYWITGRAKLEEAATVTQLGDRVGEIAFFAGETVPDGFLKRNGAAISRSAYKALFDKIGTKYGAGDGSTTFNVPDDRGLFIRGWADGGDYDTGRVFGSIQSDQNASHTHTGTANTAGAHSHSYSMKREYVDTVNTGTVNAVYGDEIREGTDTLSTTNAGNHSHSLAIAATGGNESRPINRAYLPCIKY